MHRAFQSSGCIHKHTTFLSLTTTLWSRWRCAWLVLLHIIDDKTELQMSYTVFRVVEVVSGRTGAQNLVLHFKPPTLNSVVHPVGMQRKERCSCATGMLACGTLCAIPALPTLQFWRRPESWSCSLHPDPDPFLSHPNSYILFCFAVVLMLPLAHAYLSTLSFLLESNFSCHLSPSSPFFLSLPAFLDSPFWMPFIPQPATTYQ